jgi:hypothetical protein
MDVSRHILVIDVFVFAKSNMGRREYLVFSVSIYSVLVVTVSCE